MNNSEGHGTKTDTLVAHVVSFGYSTQMQPANDSDIPAHCYQLSFESNPAWSQFYASAPEILEYWKKVAAKYDVEKYMSFQCKVTRAQWNDETAKWSVTIQPTHDGGVEFTDEADVLISAIGLLNEWRWPEISGLHDFKGDLLHSADWDTNLQLKVRFSTVSRNIPFGSSILRESG